MRHLDVRRMNQKRARICNWNHLAKSLAAAALLPLASLAAHADLLSAGVDLGTADNYSIFALSKGITISGGVPSVVDVNGDIAALGSSLILNNDVLVEGNVYYTGTFKENSHSSITGTAFHDASTLTALQQAASDANAASQSAFSLTATAGYASNISIKSDLTLTGTGNVVLSLKNFVIQKNATLTLSGDANTTFVINVTRQFLLKNGHIVLAGGLTTSNVLFNLGSKVAGASILVGSTLDGILLAPKTQVNITGGSQVKGQVIAKKVVLTGKNPPVVSP